MDSREELAADIRAWLEWQKLCGTDVWKVEDITVWDSCAQQEAPRAILKQKKTSTVPVNPPPQKQSPQRELPQSIKPIQKPMTRQKREDTALPSWWQSIYENRTKREAFDFSRIPTGGDGLQHAFSFRDKNCDAKMCKWGVGRFDAEVVVFEGYRKHLDKAGFKMLGDMRENVLRLSKNNLYWIPLKRELGCGHCDEMSLAQLNAIQPKAILVLGFEPLELLNIHDRKAAEEGGEFQIELNSSSVPAICTHHPMALLEETHNKFAARDALIAFRSILNRLRIR